MKHKFSKEILYHFNCGKCNKWWSIADYHLLSSNLELSDDIKCPHCGYSSIPIPSEEIFKKVNNV